MTESAEPTQARHAIPSDLAAFMYSLWHEAILGHEDCVEQESGDMIQAPHLADCVGGLDSKAAQRFHFLYRHHDDPFIRWDIYLFDNEIEDIADGKTTELLLWSCPDEDCENLFTHKGDICCT